jgi:hypothetical protein
MITTVEALKAQWLNVEVAREHDTLIENCILQSGAILQSICNQPLESSASNETIYFAGSSELVKTLTYTVPVALVSLSYRSLPTDSWTAIAATYTTLYQEEGLYNIYNANRYLYPYYKAVLTVGYSTIPNDLIAACSEIACELYLESQSTDGRLGLSTVNESQGGVTVTKALSSVINKTMPYVSKYIRHHI